MLEDFQTSFAGGMNDSTEPWKLRPDQCRYLQNVRVHHDGFVEVRRGTQKTHAAALDSGSQGFGGIQFTTAAGVVQWCAFVGDKFYTSVDQGLNWTERATGLREDYWSLATMRVGSTNYLLAANGGTNTYSWDGTNWATVSNIPNDVKYLAVHNERLWAYVSGITWYASKPADFSTWASPDGLVLDFHTHDGDDVCTGAYSVGELLLVFKRNSTAFTAGFGNADIIVRTGARGLFRDVGCVGFRTIVAIGGGGVAWLSERGFEYWQPGTAAPRLISAGVQNFVDQIPWDIIGTTPGLPCAVYYPRFQTYECAVPFMHPSGKNEIVFCCTIPEKDKKVLAISLIERTSEAIDTEEPYSWPRVEPFDLDTEDGYFDHNTSRMDNLGVNDEDGYLDIGPGSGYGFAFYDRLETSVTQGYLTPRAGAQDCAVLFIADVSGLPNTMVGIGYDGFVRKLEVGRFDNVDYTGTGTMPIHAFVQPRPFYFKSSLREKVLRFVRLMVAPAPDADWYIQRSTTDLVPIVTNVHEPHSDAIVEVIARADAGNQIYREAFQQAFGLSLGRHTQQEVVLYIPTASAPDAPQRSTLGRFGLKGTAFFTQILTGMGGGSQPALWSTTPEGYADTLVSSSDAGLRIAAVHAFAIPVREIP